MAIKRLSGGLSLRSLFIGLGHGIGTLRQQASATERPMMAELGITETMRQGIAVASMLLAVLIVFPETFFWETYCGPY